MIDHSYATSGTPCAFLIHLSGLYHLFVWRLMWPYTPFTSLNVHVLRIL